MRVAIVNDLAMAREALRRALAAQPGVEIAWTAGDGATAVAKTRADRPDLILMDLIMPGMDGVEATRQIMQSCPCAIVVVTATVEGNTSRVYDAISAGALDAVDTPRMNSAEGIATVARRVEAVRRMKASTHGTSYAACAKAMGLSDGITMEAIRRRCAASSCTPAASAPARAPEPPPPPEPSLHTSHRRRAPALVAIGASTGGPQAIATILQSFPADVPFATLIVQHMGSHFLPGLASWLTERTGRSVRLAQAGEMPTAGSILIAGEPMHLTVDPTGALRYCAEPSELIHRPSVDVLFDSLAESRLPPGVAVLLTGMGRDGALGLTELRRAGWHTIAQDQASSVVWGMPGAAVELDGAVQVLPLERISGAILKALSASGSTPPRVGRAELM